jgi:hypothetical protein
MGDDFTPVQHAVEITARDAIGLHADAEEIEISRSDPAASVGVDHVVPS